MKIKSIAAICKKNKNIAIFERYSDDGDILTQYISDGSAVYPVVGLPQLDKESLLTIFDVPEKDRGNAADPAPFPSMVVIYNGERVKE